MSRRLVTDMVHDRSSQSLAHSLGPPGHGLTPRPQTTLGSSRIATRPCRSERAHSLEKARRNSEPVGFEPGGGLQSARQRRCWRITGRTKKNNVHRAAGTQKIREFSKIGKCRSSEKPPPVPWNMDVPPVNTNFGDKLLLTSSHDALGKGVVESSGFFANETWLGQHFRAIEPSGAGSDEVPSGSS